MAYGDAMAESAVILDEPTPEPVYGAPMSIEEWENLPEDTPGEIVGGRLEEEEVPDFPHEIAVRWLIHALASWALVSRAVVIGSEAKFALSSRSGRKPDLSVFLSRERKLPRRGAARRPPDIMVELVSRRARDRRRDRIEKHREYAAFGVRWYWIVDPYAKTFEILRLGGEGQYTSALVADEGAVAIPGCEGLTLDLDAMWREIDELTEDEEDEES
jgi:Uma2 family endonuclease